MSRDFLDTLRGFTPDGSGLDRDALLFEAGRASVPSPVRAWLLAGVLALTQALTAGFLLQPPAPVPPARPAPPEPTYPQLADRPPLLGRLGEEGPALSADEMAPDGPPLRPFDQSLLTSLE